MAKSKGNIIESLLWIGVGIIICILALQFEIGNFNAPGPGFLPLLTGIFISAMGALMLISRNPIKKSPVKGEGISKLSDTVTSRLLYMVALLLLYIILLEPLGFILTTFFVMFSLFFDFKKRNFYASFLFSAVTASFSYIIFNVWLKCQLPRGIFPW